MQKKKLSVGSLVKCIDDVYSDEQLKIIEHKPQKGEYYFVRDLEYYPQKDITAIRLEEIINKPVPPPAAEFKEPSFSSIRFEHIVLPKIITDEF